MNGFVEAKKEELACGNRAYPTGKNQKTLIWFVASNMDIVKREYPNSKKATNAQTCFMNAVKKMNLPVKVKVRGSNLFLVKEQSC